MSGRRRKIVALLLGSSLMKLAAVQAAAVGDHLPAFTPEPLIFEVAASTGQDPARFLAMGQSALEEPLRIDPALEVEGSLTEEADLFRFMACVFRRYREMSDMREVREFSYIADDKRFEAMLADDALAARMLEMYHDLAYVEYEVGWYRSSQIYCAMLKMHQEKRPAYIVPMMFIRLEDEWRVYSGTRCRDFVGEAGQPRGYDGRLR